ncbi:amino acid ABC transporter permease [Domibacillus enclensis]|uniref:Amino acid ABC transporter membrane protein 1, PAAT family n=1 Tax=Domibacillus enclensis TaxID=1017273 RepID=A0A1N7C401_9BACI|nr:amino acid ABC transporter permease [Domibacillus enclensis]OXS74226.1 amino acid ABC transporter permease [Domibacillus enclensis]SIR58173.1 amino acid ABC transporter membrane protein 1, PAAT family [Domibacillus enclensis]
MGLDFSYMIEILPLLLDGLKLTIWISAAAIFFSLLIGITGAIVRTLKVPVLSQLVTVFVEVIRNTPLLVHVFFLYFGLPTIGITLPAVTVGILTLSIWGGAYAVENFRSGTDAVSKSLIESGQSLGLSVGQIVRYIIVPLGFRISFPAFSNTAISLIKNSAYMTSIGVAEMTFVAMDRMAYDFKTYEILISVAVIYLAVIWIASFIFSRIERKLDFNKKLKGRGYSRGRLSNIIRRTGENTAS